MPGTLLGAWSYEDLLDHSGNGRTITLSGATAQTAPGGGHTGKGLNMNSTAESFTGGLTVPTQPLQRTMMFWLMDTAAPTDGRVLEWYDSVGDNSIFRFGCRAQWHAQVVNAAEAFARVTVNRQNAVWRHITMTYDGSNIRLYIDGVEPAESPVALAGPIMTAADSFRMLYRTGAGIVIDDARIFDGALTGAEIADWMPLPADQVPSDGGKIKYESAPGVWSAVPLKYESAPGVWSPVPVKTETSPGTWEALP
jgi:hypothetical protein